MECAGFSSRGLGIRMLLIITPLIAAAALLPLRAQVAEAPSPDEIIRSFETADAKRRASMPAYTSIRDYSVENTRFRVKAGMKVEVTVDAAGAKHFRILSQTGPGAVRKLVFKRMLETEAKASTPDGQAATRICRDNYSFKFIETAVIDTRPHHVFELEPRSSNPVLFRGRIWIDAAHLAVTRIEAAPAKKPSIWVKRTGFVHQNQLLDGHWVPALNQSDSDIRIFGRSTTRIVYGDYKFAAPGPAEPDPGLATPR
jgi:hypothetical protein